MVTGLAAPAGTRERRLVSVDISTVAEFEEALDTAMELFLGVPSLSSCVVETSAIPYAVSDSVCTDAFRADQLTGSFCYSFQTTISPPTPDDGDCDVNGTASSVTEALEAGDFEDAIGSVSRCGSYLGNSCFLYS